MLVEIKHAPMNTSGALQRFRASYVKIVFMAVGGMPMRCFTVLGPSQTGKSTGVEKLGSLERAPRNSAPLMD